MPIIVHQSVTLKSITPDAELLIEQAGRCCYQSEGKTCPGSAAKMIAMLIKRGQDSVLEHASATFLVITDRGITHEIVRHRIGMSYSQESTRYVDYIIKEDGEASESQNINIKVVEPLGLDTDEKQQAWLIGVTEAEIAYRRMRLAGCPPQEARDALPTCLKADIWITGNFRAWRHFIKLRAQAKAHPKIHVIAKGIHRVLNQHAPNVFPALWPEGA